MSGFIEKTYLLNFFIKLADILNCAPIKAKNTGTKTDTRLIPFVSKQRTRPNNLSEQPSELNKTA